MVKQSTACAVTAGTKKAGTLVNTTRSQTLIEFVARIPGGNGSVQFGNRFTGKQCDQFAAWIHPDQAKARKTIPVPLNSDASAVIERQRGKHPLFVFSYQGKKMRNGNNHTWRKILKQAGIENFRWHDLHT